MIRWTLALALTLTVAFQAGAAVVDEAGLLTSQQVQALNALTAEGRVGIHIGNSTNGQSLKAYSDGWARAQKEASPNFSVAITVVPSSHQVYIFIDQNARGEFTGGDANRVINQILVPAFRSSDWSGGLTKATQAIEAHLGTSVASTAAMVPSTQTPVAPPVVAEAPKAPFDWGLVVVLVLVVGIVGALIWSSWNKKFRHFESVVSAGQPDFPLSPEVKAQPEVRDALEALQDLHRALPLEYSKRTAYYGRRKDDFRAAYETCLRAQQSWEMEKQREAEAQQRYEALKGRLDTMPEAERARFLAMEAQYQASGYNSAFLLQNMVAMDLMMHAFAPQPAFYETVIVEDRERPSDSGWQSGVDDGFDGGGSDSGDGGGW